MCSFRRLGVRFCIGNGPWWALTLFDASLLHSRGGNWHCGHFNLNIGSVCRGIRDTPSILVQRQLLGSMLEAVLQTTLLTLPRRRDRVTHV